MIEFKIYTQVDIKISGLVLCYFEHTHMIRTHFLMDHILHQIRMTYNKKYLESRKK